MGKSKNKKTEHEVDRLVARTGLRGSAREMAEQYGRGMIEGMHIAYSAVVERLLRAGNTKAEIAAFFDDILSRKEIEELIEDLPSENDGAK